MPKSTRQDYIEMTSRYRVLVSGLWKGASPSTRTRILGATSDDSWTIKLKRVRHAPISDSVCIHCGPPCVSQRLVPDKSVVFSCLNRRG